MVVPTHVSNEFTLRPWIQSILPECRATEVVSMLTNRKRRAIHDFIAGTVVVRTNIEELAEDTTLERKPSVKPRVKRRFSSVFR